MQQREAEHAQDLKSQETPVQPKEVKDSSKLKEVEFRTLRNEQFRRIMLRATFIQLLLTGFGAIIGFGVQYKLSTILFLYPFMLLWLALLWKQNADMLMRLRGYIATHIESQEYQWERTLKKQYHPIWNFDTAIMFLFLCSDLIMLGVGIAQNPHDIILITVSSVCILLTALYLFGRLPLITERVDTSPF